jgi:outer membrane immunogenic protein
MWEGRKLTKLALAAAALTLSLGAGTAMAADMRVKAPLYKAPPPVAAYSWIGCYFGGNAGWIGSRDSYDLTMDGGFLASNNIYSNPANRVGLEHSYQSNRSSGTAGLQAGCNYQVAPFVVGVEADINWSGLRETISAAYGPTQPPANAVAHTETTGNDLKWFSTFRARAGFAWDRVLIYGTAGLAATRIDSSTAVLFGTGVGFLGNSPFNGQVSVSRVGWTAGAGIEYAATDNWILRAEYLYLDFGRFDYLSPCPTNICAPAPGQAAFAYNTYVRARENVVRLGVSYKFGGPIVARY